MTWISVSISSLKTHFSPELSGNWTLWQKSENKLWGCDWLWILLIKLLLQRFAFIVSTAPGGRRPCFCPHKAPQSLRCMQMTGCHCVSCKWYLCEGCLKQLKVGILAVPDGAVDYMAFVFVNVSCFGSLMGSVCEGDGVWGGALSQMASVFLFIQAMCTLVCVQMPIQQTLGWVQHKYN